MSSVGLIACAVFGLIFGSFISAWVWRLRQQLNDEGYPKKLSAKQNRAVSMLHGRSMCPQCKHVLKAPDLVPVASWVYLRGKCRYCNTPISIQYPLVELLTAIIFSVSYLAWPYTFDTLGWVFFIGWLVTVVILLTLAIYDAKWYILPSKLIYGATAVFILTLAIYSIAKSEYAVIGNALLAGGLFFIVFAAIFFVSVYAKSKNYTSVEWLGFGDVRLSFLLGLIAGTPILVFVALFIASIVGLLASLPSLANKSRTLTSKMPFGPFLIAGGILTFLFGQIIIDWYTSVFLGI